MAAVFLLLTSIIKFVTPTAERDEWKELNDELNLLLSPYHHHLSRCNNPEDAAHLGDQITIVIRDFLLSKPELFVDEKSNSEFFKKHQSKPLEQLKKLKNDLRRRAFGKNGTEEDRKQFREAV